MSETAPQQTIETPPQGTMTATEAAIVNDSLSDYRKGWAAEKEGKPLPNVPKPGALSDDDYQKLRDRQQAGDFLTEAERKSLRATQRARRQDEINDKARSASEKAVQTVRDEYDAKLKAANERAEKAERALSTHAAPPAVAPAPRPVAAAPADTAKAPDPNDATKYPGGVYDPQYIEDKAVHRFQQEQAAKDQTARETQQRETQQRAWVEAKGKFHETLAKAKETDPEFQSVIDGELASKRLVPVEEFAALQAANILPKDAQPGPENFLASYLVGQSTIGYQLLKHLHQNPDVLARVLTEGPPALYRLEGQLLTGSTTPPASGTPPASAPPPKVVTSAPAPPTVLGTREAAPTNPVEAAIASGKGNVSGGVRDYMAERRREMAASRGR